MSPKEEIIDRAIVIKNLKHNYQSDIEMVEEDECESRFFRGLKRKYRLMLAYLFFFSMILIFMILPIVIGAIAHGLWW